jgi:hypothetical protein
MDRALRMCWNEMEQAILSVDSGDLMLLESHNTIAGLSSAQSAAENV